MRQHAFAIFAIDASFRCRPRVCENARSARLLSDVPRVAASSVQVFSLLARNFKASSRGETRSKFSLSFGSKRTLDFRALRGGA
jgi:hypothetical protein